MAITRAAAVGDDLAMFTGYSQGSEHGSAYGMNRLESLSSDLRVEGWRSSTPT